MTAPSFENRLGKLLSSDCLDVVEPQIRVVLDRFRSVFCGAFGSIDFSYLKNRSFIHFMHKQRSCLVLQLRGNNSFPIRVFTVQEGPVRFDRVVCDITELEEALIEAVESTLELFQDIYFDCTC